ncbi:MAG: class I SAM-dependent methyltransferase [Deltaproteobacteria bacterium]|nr:class I SAM-dependent methyltransferase [Deltaproteobacteria bacterium]
MQDAAASIDVDALSGVSETLLVPLYCRAIESGHPRRVLTDDKAVAVVAQLDRALAASNRRLHRKLLARKLPSKLALSMALRTRCFDRYSRDFLGRAPDGAIVSLGCGLDTRFERIDNGRAQWFDLDLPEVMAWRRQFFEEHARRRFIAASVSDEGWREQIAPCRDRPLLFLAEGLLMYLEPEQVRSLVLGLQRHFAGCELVAEVFSSRWVSRMRSPLLQLKFRRQCHLDASATFKSGIADSREFERWNGGIELIDDWTYFDDREQRLGWMISLLGRFESTRRLQWTVRYRLGAGSTSAAPAVV